MSNYEALNPTEKEFFRKMYDVIEEHSRESGDIASEELRGKIKSLLLEMRYYYSGENREIEFIQCWSCGEYFNPYDYKAEPEQRYCGHC